MKKLLIFAVLFSSCNWCRWERVTDQPKAQELFLECLSKVPKGPENITASGNDWDEVVETCKQSSIDLTSKYIKVCE